MLHLEKFPSDRCDLRKELKFPVGSSYGWGYKYSHLCYAFFEAGAFTVTLQLGDSCVPAVEKMLPALAEKANRLWRDRYPCGEPGGWIQDWITGRGDLDDVFELIEAKKRPVRSGRGKPGGGGMEKAFRVFPPPGSLSCAA